MRAESLSLLQALEARVGSVFADVETRTYQNGECLVRQGHEPEGLLLMSSGLAQARWSGLEEGDGPVLGPGSVVGDVSYLLGGVARASVVVLERVEELLPYLLLTRSAERMYRKPRGYAGDFLTIDWMYADEPGGAGALGVALDRCFLDQPAAQAVRNRRALLLEELQRALSLTEHRPLRVTSLACGPAAEIFDILLQEPGLSEQVQFTLVDVDQQALEHVE